MKKSIKIRNKEKIKSKIVFTVFLLVITVLFVWIYKYEEERYEKILEYNSTTWTGIKECD